jgi:crotonobetainyl-CoA:carnitine CoA-transferase CaiB-like acyl-CoA transferase
MNDPQVIHNKLIETIDQPTLGSIRQSRPAARFDRTPARIAGPAPRVGEHSAEVLRELGYSIEDIAALMESRAAKAAS